VTNPALPPRIDIVEVSPRDGLQNEKTLISTEAKVELISRAVAAGAKRIEATSFVNPKKVPQMADAQEVMAGVPRVPGVSYIGLALNDRGYARAAEAKCDEVNFVVAATDGFNIRNQGVPVHETLRMWTAVAAAARADKMPVSMTIATSFGCPFDGEVAVSRLVEVVKAAAAEGPCEIALADTIGVAAPTDLLTKIAAVKPHLNGARLRIHLHNTRNTGFANAFAAVMAGAEVLDSSIGGIGGCPFAPNATGNIATEDLVYMLERMGISTGLNVTGLNETARWIAGQLGKPVPGMVSKAPAFPPEAPAQAARA